MQAVNAGVHRTYSMFVEILEKSPNFEIEVENVLHLLFYIWKKRSKGGCLEGKDFLFMMVSILPVSLSRRNNQGII